MTLRLLQIGLGGWGRNWVKEVTREVPGVEPVGWVDIEPESRERAIAELGLPAARVFASLAEARIAVAADAALVAVPLAAHAAVAEAALAAGLHVLVEKPFTERLADAVRLTRLAQARGLKLMVNQNYRWFPASVLARRLVREGRIGRPMAVYLDFHLLYGPDYRYFFLDEPLLGDMAIHHFDGLRFVLGDEPALVSCQSWNEPDSPFQGRPAAIATIRFGHGTLASYRGSWISRGPTTPYGGHWRLDGTAGAIELTFRGAFAQREKLDRLILYQPGRPAEAAPLPDVPLKDRKGALAAFARWVRDGVPPEGASTAEDNLQSLALMLAAIRSAREDGTAVPVRALLEEAGA
jgi:predicted dehydrogenase